MPRRSACVSRIVRVEAVELVPAYAQSRLRRGLIIEMQSSLLFGIGADLVEVEARIRARVAEGLRLPFVLVVAEIMQAVFDDRPAVGPTELLIRVGQHPLLHEIRGHERVVAEIAGEAPRPEFPPDFEIAFTCTPIEPPCVASKRPETNSNSAIASRL